MADDPTAYLAGIKDRAKAAADFPLAEFAGLINHDTKTVGGWIAASALDVPALVAAVEAVLKAADRLSRKTVKGSPLERIRGECAEVIREAVRAALTGEEAGDGT